MIHRKQEMHYRAAGHMTGRKPRLLQLPTSGTVCPPIFVFPSQYTRKAAEIKAMEGGLDFASKKGIQVFENKVQLRYL